MENCNDPGKDPVKTYLSKFQWPDAPSGARERIERAVFDRVEKPAAERQSMIVPLVALAAAALAAVLYFTFKESEEAPRRSVVDAPRGGFIADEEDPSVLRFPLAKSFVFVCSDGAMVCDNEFEQAKFIALPDEVLREEAANSFSFQAGEGSMYLFRATKSGLWNCKLTDQGWQVSITEGFAPGSIEESEDPHEGGYEKSIEEMRKDLRLVGHVQLGNGGIEIWVGRADRDAVFVWQKDGTYKGPGLFVNTRSSERSICSGEWEPLYFHMEKYHAYVLHGRLAESENAYDKYKLLVTNGPGYADPVLMSETMYTTLREFDFDSLKALPVTGRRLQILQIAVTNEQEGVLPGKDSIFSLLWCENGFEGVENGRNKYSSRLLFTADSGENWRELFPEIWKAGVLLNCHVPEE